MRDYFWRYSQIRRGGKRQKGGEVKKQARWKDPIFPHCLKHRDSSRWWCATTRNVCLVTEFYTARSHTRKQTHTHTHTKAHSPLSFSSLSALHWYILLQAFLTHCQYLFMSFNSCLCWQEIQKAANKPRPFSTLQAAHFISEQRNSFDLVINHSKKIINQLSLKSAPHKALMITCETNF